MKYLFSLFHSWSLIRRFAEWFYPSGSIRVVLFFVRSIRSPEPAYRLRLAPPLWKLEFMSEQWKQIACTSIHAVTLSFFTITPLPGTYNVKGWGARLSTWGKNYGILRVPRDKIERYDSDLRVSIGPQFLEDKVAFIFHESKCSNSHVSTSG